MKDKNDLPALYVTAGRISDRSQSLFLWLVRGEYFFLFIAAVMALEFYSSVKYFLSYAIVLLAGLAMLLVRSLMKPEQQWYRARAVAESIKTSSWRYMMRAHPYDGRSDDVAAKRQFLDYLREIIKTNEVLKHEGQDDRVGAEQITQFMLGTRLLSLQERMSFYMEKRAAQQQDWYSRKAQSNRASFKRWIAASVTAYVIAILLAMSRIAFPDWEHVPLEPLILFASSVLGWVQIKKHTELASAYRLTAREIGLAREDFSNSLNEEEFSAFVNDSELAFSREHTQWVARQQTAG